MTARSASPLQKVLDWRRTQLELEEAKFRQRDGRRWRRSIARAPRWKRGRAKPRSKCGGGTRSPAAICTRSAITGCTCDAQERRWRPARAECCATGWRRSRRRCWRRAAAAGCWSGCKERRLWPSGRRRRIARLDALASESYLAQWRPPSARGRAALPAYNEIHDPRHSCRNRSARRAADCRRRERAAPDDAFPLAGVARARRRRLAARSWRRRPARSASMSEQRGLLAARA